MFSIKCQILKLEQRIQKLTTKDFLMNKGIINALKRRKRYLEARLVENGQC